MKRTERELDRCRHLLPHDLPADAVVHASLSPANAAVTEAHFERYLLGFGSSLFTILLLLVLVPRPISERLSTLRGDGLNLVEVYERIARNPRPIDIAFIGTSHTMTGIDDRGIEEQTNTPLLPALRRKSHTRARQRSKPAKSYFTGQGSRP